MPPHGGSGYTKAQVLSGRRGKKQLHSNPGYRRDKTTAMAPEAFEASAYYSTNYNFVYDCIFLELNVLIVNLATYPK